MPWSEKYVLLPLLPNDLRVLLGRDRRRSAILIGFQVLPGESAARFRQRQRRPHTASHPHGTLHMDVMAELEGLDDSLDHAEAQADRVGKVPAV